MMWVRAHDGLTMEASKERRLARRIELQTGDDVSTKLQQPPIYLTSWRAGSTWAHTCLCSKGNVNSIPVTVLGGPRGCRTLSLPHFIDYRLTDDAEVVRLTYWPHFTMRKISSTHSLRGWVDLRAKVRLEWLTYLKIQQPHRKTNPRPPRPPTLRMPADLRN
jgi:hypothetical protein